MIQEHSSGILLLLVSLLLLFFPRQIWKVTEAWKNSKNTSPSKAYSIVLRCLGVIFLIAGILLLFRVLNKS